MVPGIGRLIRLVLTPSWQIAPMQIDQFAFVRLSCNENIGGWINVIAGIKLGDFLQLVMLEDGIFITPGGKATAHGGMIQQSTVVVMIELLKRTGFQAGGRDCNADL
jgi:hypothetical protein